VHEKDCRGRAMGRVMRGGMPAATQRGRIRAYERVRGDVEVMWG